MAEPFQYRTPPELAGGATTTVPVVVIGAGPVGLSLAIDLALHGVQCILLDDNNVVSVGSRAICWAKRTLEIFDRLGVAEPMLAEGVTWSVGRLFDGDREVYKFDLLPEPGHKIPAFINLQQFTVEEILVARCAALAPLVDLRWKNKVVAHRDDGATVTLTIDTPDGSYELVAQYIVACDGARSATRERMGLRLEGHTFDEQFLIADVETAEDPFGSDVPERWFWFRPPFHNGQSALLHKQPRNIYRIDLQLGPDADPALEQDPERVAPRIRQMVGDKPFRLDWLSIYRFTCARLARFVHGRVVFAGDAAHVVSPFGARGGNGGIQDADNLAWKLAAILSGKASPSLLESYDEERGLAADENLENSARATAFMTPKSPAEVELRDAVLALAAEAPFAQRLVNSGRLSTPARLRGACFTPSDRAVMPVGSPAIDAPVTQNGNATWLLDRLNEAPAGFCLLTIGHAFQQVGVAGLPSIHIALDGEAGAFHATPLFLERYGDKGAYLLRPDRHVAAFFGQPDNAAISAAVRTAYAGRTHIAPQPSAVGERTMDVLVP